jgi:hypothetical protein
MEPTAQLPELLAALLFGAMLATYTQVVAWRRKVREDRLRYHQRMKRNHGGPRRGRQAPPDA